MLVVVGILIALQIDNWREARIERTKEHQLLIGLRNDITKDIQILNTNLEDISKSKIAGDSILQLLKYPDKINHSVFFRNCAAVMINKYFQTNSGLFDQSVSTGKIAIIKSNKLRDDLFDYYRNTKLNYEDEESRHFFREQFAPAMAEILWSTKEVSEILGFNTSLPSIDMQQISANQKFYEVMMIRIVAYRYQIKALKTFLKNAIEIKKTLNTELARFAS